MNLLLWPKALASMASAMVSAMVRELAKSGSTMAEVFLDPLRECALLEVDAAGAVSVHQGAHLHLHHWDEFPGGGEDEPTWYGMNGILAIT